LAGHCTATHIPLKKGAPLAAFKTPENPLLQAQPIGIFAPELFDGHATAIQAVEKYGVV